VEREDPSVFLMDLDLDEHATRIDLSARHANEVLREESLKSGIIPYKQEITRFVEQLKNHQLSKRVSFIDNLMGIIDQMEGQKSIDREMRDLIATIQQKKKGAINE
jgi:uncharacterized protein YaaR (DUF327 family)